MNTIPHPTPEERRHAIKARQKRADKTPYEELWATARAECDRMIALQSTRVSIDPFVLDRLLVNCEPS